MSQILAKTFCLSLALIELVLSSQKTSRLLETTLTNLTPSSANQANFDEAPTFESKHESSKTFEYTHPEELPVPLQVYLDQKINVTFFYHRESAKLRKEHCKRFKTRKQSFNLKIIL